MFALTIATGSNAVTILHSATSSNIDPLLTSSSSTPTPSTPAIASASGVLRNRKRKIPTEWQDEPDTKTHKTISGETYAPMEKVAAAITLLAQARRGVLQIAVTKLQDNYTRRLTAKHIEMALDCLESETKAAIFGSLREGEGRDRWLERKAGVEIIRAWGQDKEEDDE